MSIKHKKKYECPYCHKKITLNLDRQFRLHRVTTYEKRGDWEIPTVRVCSGSFVTVSKENERTP